MINQTTLPTLDKLDAKVKPGVDIKKVASEWLESFTSHVRSGDVDNIVGLFVEDALFKDILALTWNFRTFEGTNTIGNFLRDCLPEAQLSSFKLKDEYLQLQQPYPDLAWIQALFEFETAVGWHRASSVSCQRLMGHGKRIQCSPLWKTLKASQKRQDPSDTLIQIRANGKRNESKRSSLWVKTPQSLLWAGSQSGLGIARLKCLDVPTLSWRGDPRVEIIMKRYEALCLHDPVCKFVGVDLRVIYAIKLTIFRHNHMPYIPSVVSFHLYVIMLTFPYSAFRPRGRYSHLYSKVYQFRNLPHSWAV